MQRGVITTGAKIVATENGHTAQFMSPEMLRYYALYWDKVVLTDSRILRIRLNSEMELLEQASVLTKERGDVWVYGFGPMPGEESVNAHHAATASVASRLCHENPGQWSIHQETQSLILPPDLSVEKTTAEIQLLNCLPIPKADVPLDKVLDFKINREAELESLRMALDEIYLSIVSSGDIPRAVNLETTKLDKAIAELSTVAKESWGTGILGGRRVYLELSAEAFAEGVKYATAGALYAGSLGAVVGGVTGTIVSSIRVELDHSFQLNVPTGKHGELSYLTSLRSKEIVD